MNWRIRQYQDSTPLAHDSSGLRRQFDDEGYLYLRNILPSENVASVRDHILRTALAAGWLRADSGNSPVDPTRAVWDPDPEYRAVHRKMWTAHALHSLM